MFFLTSFQKSDFYLKYELNVTWYNNLMFSMETLRQIAQKLLKY